MIDDDFDDTSVEMTAGKTEVEAAAKKQKRVVQEAKQRLKRMMNTRDFRDWVWAVLSEAQVFHSVFDRDPLVMAFREGKRNRGLQLMNEILIITPAQYQLMQTENNGELNEQ